MSLFVNLVLVACAPQPATTPDAVSCGEGTHEEDGVCVPDEADTGGTGDTDSDGTGDTDTGPGDDTAVDTDTGGDTDSDTGEPACDVDDDGGVAYTDIQDAVDAASDGDTVFVCAGSYSYVEIARDDVSLEGVDGADATIIDGGSSPAITLDNVTSAISGFTLTGSGDTNTAGALWATDATFTVTDAVISGCTSSAYNNCVLQERGDSTWDNVVFEDNAPQGMVFAAYDSTTTREGTVDMSHATFRNNGGGGLIMVVYIDLLLTNSLFHDNTGTANTETIRFNLYDAPNEMTVWNNTFANNSSTGGTTTMVVGDKTDFQNNIVSGSSAYVYIYDSVSADYNDYFDNGTVHYYDGGREVHSLEANPYFTDADAGDYTLEPGFSPCIDAGNPLSGYNDPDGSRNDLGAFGGPAGSW